MNKQKDKPQLKLDFHDIKRKMREMAKAAVEIIRNECHDLVVEDKKAYDGAKWDCVTAADKKAQEMYLEEIKKHFPTFGIIAEEKELMIPCTDADIDAYFTVDPLDGTKAYARKQSHGVSTMLALVVEGLVVAVTIADANTGEIYEYAAAEEFGDATRIRFGKESLLEPDIKRPLRHQYLLLLDNPRIQPEIVKDMILDFPAEGGLFKDFEIQGGSIGLRFARLWKGEIGGIILTPGFETPWDATPVVGISRRLGFKFLRLADGGRKFVEHEPELVKNIVKKPYVELVIHEKHVPELQKWIGAWQEIDAR